MTEVENGVDKEVIQLYYIHDTRTDRPAIGKSGAITLYNSLGVKRAMRLLLRQWNAAKPNDEFPYKARRCA